MKETIEQKKKRALKILDILHSEYPDYKCHLNYENPFQLLISTMLAAQCTDERVNTVMDELYKKYKSPDDFVNVKAEVLEKELSTINFYRNKTKSVQACCRSLIDEYGGKVPETMEELTKLAGVGRKSANVVLGNCFGKPAIMTDTHLIRVSQRLGLAENDKPEKMEIELKALIPDELQTQYSHLIGEHGRQICNAKKPLCEDCCVNKLCLYYHKNKND